MSYTPIKLMNLNDLIDINKNINSKWMLLHRECSILSDKNGKIAKLVSFIVDTIYTHRIPKLTKILYKLNTQVAKQLTEGRQKKRSKDDTNHIKEFPVTRKLETQSPYSKVASNVIWYFLKFVTYNEDPDPEHVDLKMKGVSRNKFNTVTFKTSTVPSIMVNESIGTTLIKSVNFSNQSRLTNATKVNVSPFLEFNKGLKVDHIASDFNKDMDKQKRPLCFLFFRNMFRYYFDVCYEEIKLGNILKDPTQRTESISRRKKQLNQERKFISTIFIDYDIYYYLIFIMYLYKVKFYKKLYDLQEYNISDEYLESVFSVIFCRSIEDISSRICHFSTLPNNRSNWFCRFETYMSNKQYDDLFAMLEYQTGKKVFNLIEIPTLSDLDYTEPILLTKHFEGQSINNFYWEFLIEPHELTFVRKTVKIANTETEQEENIEAVFSFENGDYVLFDVITVPTPPPNVLSQSFEYISQLKWSKRIQSLDIVGTHVGNILVKGAKEPIKVDFEDLRYFNLPNPILNTNGSYHYYFKSCGFGLGTFFISNNQQIRKGHAVRFNGPTTDKHIPKAPPSVL